jgi:hypothetical protein
MVAFAVAAALLLSVALAAAVLCGRSARRAEPVSVTPPVASVLPRKLTLDEWTSERDRLFAKYAIPEDFRVRCVAHYREVDAQFGARMARRARERSGSQGLAFESMRERAKVRRSDPLYAAGEADCELEQLLKIWDPELIDVTDAMLCGLEQFLKERYDAYLAATGEK